ncbi:Hypothetical_protein [Hexamita inflata]|uniref:Hypothetical_protein n=1 Tax=Hexamita inflata TaxID=28002 RepID=A0AA86QKD1_9EUKA|nr:Hypothetical protein HINF_LOCUS48754 [Hexamita inflata]
MHGNAACQHYIKVNHQQYNYCQKALHLNNRHLNGLLILPQNNNQMFIYSESIKNSKLNVKVDEMFSFSVFGFANSQELLNTQINVTIEFKVVEAALICQQCNLKSTDSSFVFVASGNRISGLVLYSENEINLLRTQLQFRINGLEQGGIVHKISKQVNILLTDVNVTGRFSDDNIITGNIVVHILDFTTITLTNFYICTNSASNYVSIKEISNWNLVGIINTECQTICNLMYFTYGLCLSDLQFGKLLNNQRICSNNFNFINDSCQCKQDHVLNGTHCVSILGYLQDIDTNISQMQSNILTDFSLLESRINSNVTSLNGKISSVTNSLNMSIQTSFSTSQQKLSNASKSLDTKTATYYQQYDNIILSNFTQMLQNLNKSVNISKQLINNSNNSVLNNISATGSDFDELLENASDTLHDTLSNISYQLNRSINQVKTNMSNLIYQKKDLLQTAIDRIKCIQGDCQNINNIIITGATESYCSGNENATIVCSKYESFRTVTVPNTCEVKLNTVSGNVDLYTYCCSPQGYWNEDTETCEHITYT